MVAAFQRFSPFQNGGPKALLTGHHQAPLLLFPFLFSGFAEGGTQPVATHQAEVTHSQGDTHAEKRELPGADRHADGYSRWLEQVPRAGA